MTRAYRTDPAGYLRIDDDRQDVVTEEKIDVEAAYERMLKRDMERWKQVPKEEQKADEEAAPELKHDATDVETAYQKMLWHERNRWKLDTMSVDEKRRAIVLAAALRWR